MAGAAGAAAEFVLAVEVVSRFAGGAVQAAAIINRETITTIFFMDLLLSLLAERVRCIPTATAQLVKESWRSEP
jgi:hypothetical protein